MLKRSIASPKAKYGLHLLFEFLLCMESILNDRFVVGIAIDNAVTGEPELVCEANSLRFEFQTKNPFRGKVYVKDHFNNPNCKIDFSRSDEHGNPVATGQIVVSHGACDMERARMINPAGIQFSVVIVISFHPIFITKVDRAYKLECVYQEHERTLDVGLDVQELTTQSLNVQSTAPPTCTYTIHKDHLDGEILQYAAIGQTVVHRWECDTDMYGLLVHDCVIADGVGDEIKVLDSKGCHVDQYVIGDLVYDPTRALAYREAHVVKFADRLAVHFKCQIKLCVKQGGGCNGVTPVDCRQQPTTIPPLQPVITQPTLRLTVNPATPPTTLPPPPLSTTTSIYRSTSQTQPPAMRYATNRLVILASDKPLSDRHRQSTIAVQQSSNEKPINQSSINRSMFTDQQRDQSGGDQGQGHAFSELFQPEEQITTTTASATFAATGVAAPGVPEYPEDYEPNEEDSSSRTKLLKRGWNEQPKGGRDTIQESQGDQGSQGFQGIWAAKPRLHRNRPRSLGTNGSYGTLKDDLTALDRNLQSRKKRTQGATVYSSVLGNISGDARRSLGFIEGDLRSQQIYVIGTVENVGATSDGAFHDILNSDGLKNSAASEEQFAINAAGQNEPKRFRLVENNTCFSAPKLSLLCSAFLVPIIALGFTVMVQWRRLRAKPILTFH